jgi:hypothetical protein
MFDGCEEPDTVHQNARKTRPAILIRSTLHLGAEFAVYERLIAHSFSRLLKE